MLKLSEFLISQQNFLLRIVGFVRKLKFKVFTIFNQSVFCHLGKEKFIFCDILMAPTKSLFYRFVYEISAYPSIIFEILNKNKLVLFQDGGKSEW